MSQSIHLLSDLTTFGAIAATSLTAAGMLSAARLNIVSDAVIGTSLAVAGPISGSSFSGVGSSLTALNASNLSSGTVPQARLGISGSRDTSTFLRGDGSWTNAVTAVSVVNANGISASVANQGSTPQITLTLGAITPSSINSAGSVTASVFIPTQSAIPTTGIYASSSGSVAIATNTLERFKISQAGQINIGGPTVRTINAVPASAIDCSKGDYFTKTYTGALTWTFTNVPTSGFYSFILRLIRGASGTQTWPSSVRWTGGTAPSLTNTNGGSDIFEFMTDNGGTTWRAFRRTTTTT